MLLHQDASRHAWLAGAPPLDLVVTLDDATSEVYSAFLVEEEGIPQSPLRPHFVRAKVRVHEYPGGRLAVFWGPHRLAEYDAEGRSIIRHALAA